MHSWQAGASGERRILTNADQRRLRADKRREQQEKTSKKPKEGKPKDRKDKSEKIAEVEKEKKKKPEKPQKKKPEKPQKPKSCRVVNDQEVDELRKRLVNAADVLLLFFRATPVRMEICDLLAFCYLRERERECLNDQGCKSTQRTTSWLATGLVSLWV